MKKIAVKLFFALALIGVFTFQTQAQTIGVSGSIEKKSVKRGSTGKGTIILSIPGDLHINSNQPSSEFLIPTTIKLHGKSVKIGKITYPKGKERKFEFSENPINIYEARTLIKFTFTVPRNFKSKTIQIRALVSYQACTNEVCYAPQKKWISLKASVK